MKTYTEREISRAIEDHKREKEARFNRRWQNAVVGLLVALVVLLTLKCVVDIARERCVDDIARCQDAVERTRK